MSAPAAVIYRLGGKCSSFSAQVGVDDSSTRRLGRSASRSSPTARRCSTAARWTATAPAMAVNVSLTGKRRLKLLVTNADDGNALDRASWGDAKVECEP